MNGAKETADATAKRARDAVPLEICAGNCAKPASIRMNWASEGRATAGATGKIAADSECDSVPVSGGEK